MNHRTVLTQGCPRGNPGLVNASPSGMGFTQQPDLLSKRHSDQIRRLIVGVLTRLGVPVWSAR